MIVIFGEDKRDCSAYEQPLSRENVNFKRISKRKITMWGAAALLVLTLIFICANRYRKLGDIIGYANPDSVYLMTILRSQPDAHRPPWDEMPQFFIYPFALNLGNVYQNQVLSAELGEELLTVLLNLRVRPLFNKTRRGNSFEG
jgi:hypothetical protein